MKESPQKIAARAEQLIESHYQLLQSLIALRKRNGLSQEIVGERMGISQPAVAAFEASDSNPTLSSVRRYAHAVGARIIHQVISDIPVKGHSRTKSKI